MFDVIVFIILWLIMNVFFYFKIVVELFMNYVWNYWGKGGKMRDSFYVFLVDLGWMIVLGGIVCNRGL